MAASFKPGPEMLRKILGHELVDKACQHAAERGVEYAKSIAPVRTGAYRDGIKAEKHEEDSGRVSWRIVATDNKSHWIEYGAEHTVKQRILGKTAEHLGGADG